MATNWQSFLHGIGELLTPILKDSKFKETGLLTPEEFVAAGDFLTLKCPTWHWESGIESKQRSYLPSRKQFLMTRNVLCQRRAKDVVSDMSAVVDEALQAAAAQDGIDDEWLMAGTGDARVSSTAKGTEEEIGDIDKELSVSSDSESVPDMESYENADNLIEETDDPTAVHRPSAKKNDNVAKSRSYDLFVTYDKYYQTPRFWLYGYDEDLAPLDHLRIFEDISEEHANKTATIEVHPHLQISLVSIHPCRHANVMKKLVERIEDGLTEEQRSSGGIRVDQYLLIFLKFMATIMPTIDYDHTAAVQI